MKCHHCKKQIREGDHYMQVVSRVKGRRMHYGRLEFCDDICHLHHLNDLLGQKKGGIEALKEVL